MTKFRLFLSVLIVACLIVPTQAAQTAYGGSTRNRASLPEGTAGPVVNDAAAVRLLFVQTADGGTFDGTTIVLKDVPPTIYFADRPHRYSGVVETRKFMEHWDKGEESFKNDPPNAAIQIFNAEGKVTGAVVELVDATLVSHSKEGDVISYKVRLLNGKLPATFGQCSLFIDHSDGWAIAGGVLGGMMLANMANNSRQQTTVVERPVYVYGPPPGYYGYAPQPYYEQTVVYR